MDGGCGDLMEVDGEAQAAGAAGLPAVVLMWGYLPGVSAQRSPLLSPVVVPMPDTGGTSDAWVDVCGGGCGFAMAISEHGKLFTWGSMDDMSQSYVASGKHEEIPEVYPLPDDVSVVNADAGWAHCVAVTANKDVYTWGWKECVPTGRIVADQSSGGMSEKEIKQGGFAGDQGRPRLQTSRTSSGPASGFESRTKEEDKGTKRRKVVSVKQGEESSTSSDETLSSPPCLVTFTSAVRIVAVAAGGRHTLALSDVGQVWGWGYGGEGQLGLGSRIRSVSSPHPIPCIEAAFYSKDRSVSIKDNRSSEGGPVAKMSGTCVKAIACGGRHSAVITDSGALLTFGWGLYGQCGHGSTDDMLSPTCVSSLLGIKMQGIAAGLWHTVCSSVDGDVYSFGGNQFGQLGTGSDQAETLPKLIEASCLESKNAKSVSCGARHSAMITDEGELFCWGWNKYGQLGVGDAIDRNVPSRVSIEAANRPTKVTCGWWHTLALARYPT